MCYNKMRLIVLCDIIGTLENLRYVANKTAIDTQARSIGNNRVGTTAYYGRALIN